MMWPMIDQLALSVKMVSARLTEEMVEDVRREQLVRACGSVVH